MSLDLLSNDIEALIRRLRDEAKVPEAHLICVRAAIEDGLRASPLPSSDVPTSRQTPRSRGSSQRMPAVRFPLDEDDGDE